MTDDNFECIKISQAQSGLEIMKPERRWTSEKCGSRR